jgi:L-lysine 2,3-aminomutase
MFDELKVAVSDELERLRNANTVLTNEQVILKGAMVQTE